MCDLDVIREDDKNLLELFNFWKFNLHIGPKSSKRFLRELSHELTLRGIQFSYLT